MDVRDCISCRCKGSETCPQCCFGFTAEQGIWMEDWDGPLRDAVDSAHRKVELNFYGAALQLLRLGFPVSLFFSDVAMAELLDIAILTGDKEAAMSCALQTKLRPLRRWTWHGIFQHYFFDSSRCRLTEDVTVEFLSSTAGTLELKDPHMLVAALSAGVQLQTLTLWHCPTSISFREAVALSGCEWSYFANLLPKPDWQWRRKAQNHFGCFFLNRNDHGVYCLCKKRLQNSRLAGLQVETWAVRCHRSPQGSGFLSLLDLAVLFGQPDCAALCAHKGSKLWAQLRQRLPKSLDAHPTRKSAAVGAAHVAMALAWRSEIAAKGVVIYQAVTHSSSGHCPAAAVGLVVSFAMEVPKIIEQLDLRKEAHALLASWSYSPTPAIPCKDDAESMVLRRLGFALKIGPSSCDYGSFFHPFHWFVVIFSKTPPATSPGRRLLGPQMTHAMLIGATLCFVQKMFRRHCSLR